MGHLTLVAESFGDFLGRLVPFVLPPDARLEITEAWINPDFLQEMRREGYGSSKAGPPDLPACPTSLITKPG